MSNEALAAIVLPLAAGGIALIVWLLLRSHKKRGERWRAYARARGFHVPHTGSAWQSGHLEMEKREGTRQVLLRERSAGSSGNRSVVGIRVQLGLGTLLPSGLFVDTKRWDLGLSRWFGGGRELSLDDPELTACFPSINGRSFEEVRQFFQRPTVRAFFLAEFPVQRPYRVFVLDGMLTLDVGKKIEDQALDAAQRYLHELADRLEAAVAASKV